MFMKTQRIEQAKSLHCWIAFFINEENMVNNIHCCSALGKSDNVVISCQFYCYIKPNTSISKKLNYAKGNYTDMINDKSNRENRLVSKTSIPASIYLQLLSRSITDHHLRCGGWLNFEFSKRGKNIWDGPLKLFTRSKAEVC